MNNLKISFHLLLTTTLLIPACTSNISEKVEGDGIIVSKIIELQKFNSIEISGSFDVELIPGEAPEIKILSDSNLMNYVMNEIQGNTLKVYTSKQISLKPTDIIKLKIQVQDLKSISIDGSTSITSQNIGVAKHFSININGSGSYNGELQTQQVEVNISGSGNVLLTGSSDKITSQISGSGIIDSRNLISSAGTAIISGSGDIYMQATELLDVQISGKGDVYYQGTPATISQKISGSGKLIPL
jgi:hypothetical protein